MTLDEAKKAGFRCVAGGVSTWEIIGNSSLSHHAKDVSILGPGDFPTREKARAELKRRRKERAEKVVAECSEERKRRELCSVGSDPLLVDIMEQGLRASDASHETPSGESQTKEVSTGETQTILEEAMKCVSGPRRRDYGTADENFGAIASLWSVILKKPVTAMQVAMCMIAMKIARQMNTSKRDNLVDIAGYAQCASELKESK